MLETSIDREALGKIARGRSARRRQRMVSAITAGTNHQPGGRGAPLPAGQEAIAATGIPRT